MSGSLRDYLIGHGLCPCDPTRGQSCPHCDGSAAEQRDLHRHRRATTETPR